MCNLMLNSLYFIYIYLYVSSVLCYLMIIMDFTEDLWVKCVFFRLDLGLCKYVFIPRESVTSTYQIFLSMYHSYIS